MSNIVQEIPTKTNFLHKSLRGIKSFLYRSRKNLPSGAVLGKINYLATNSNHYSWEEDETHQYRAVKKPQDAGGSFVKFPTMAPSEKIDDQQTKARGNLQGDFVDAKMEELVEIENVVDMEEAIHYYSRLRSPVYLGIVNQFLREIYSDFDVDDQEASASIVNSSSKRRFSSTRQFEDWKLVNSGCFNP